MDQPADLRWLAGIVGVDRFEAACEWAWRTAAGTGKSDRDDVEWPDDLAEVPHDLADPVWYDTTDPLGERLAVAQALYRTMPCYANLMYVLHFYDEFGPRERDTFWREYRALLQDPDARLADPVAYSLWVDYYEAGYTEAWRETASFEPPWERRLQRVLENSGPVKWKLKEPVYERLAGDQRWHPFIFLGLLGSAFDVYGDLKRRRARALLRRLDVPDGASGLAELREKLRA
jgi:hypothetical protein